MKRKTIVFLFLLIGSIQFLRNSFAQPQEESSPAPQQVASVATPAADSLDLPAADEAKPKEKVSTTVTVTPAITPISQNVTLDFKDADIRNVLKILAYKSGVNIVATPEVIGNVTIRLVDVPWERALEVLLMSYGYGSQRQGNIILVTKIENMSKIQAEEPLKTEIFTLKFLDAQDAEKILIPMLSSRGRISILYTRGQKGWSFGTFKIGRDTTQANTMVREEEEKTKTETIALERGPGGEIVSKKAEFEPSVKSKVLVVTDTAASLERVRNVILPVIDRMPKQVLIETRFMEVNRDKLRDLGVDWGTGSSGATGYTTAPTDLHIFGGQQTAAGRNLGSEFTPSAFNPIEGTTVFPGTYPYKAGLELIFKKIAGKNFEVIMHALEEDAHTNTLSAPRIMTLDNQEASILVGYHTPILTSTVTAGTTTGTGATITQTLDYYQEIGIRLNVVPQVSEEGYINMIVHPSVTSSTSSVTATSTASGATTTTDYPIIDVRETQTQILIKDGETIVIGGLLKDIKKKETIGIPFFSKIPIFGGLFRRDTYDTQKIDLLMFITARIIKEGEFTPEEIVQLQKGVNTIEDPLTAKKAKANP